MTAASLEVQRLSRLVDRMLALTRAGTDQPQRQPAYVGAVIAERCSAWSALAAERQVVLTEGSRSGTGPVAMLVPGDLDQIVDNLLANALDACPRRVPGPCRGRASRGRHLRELHVVDNGLGLGPEDRERAFERFWQRRPPHHRQFRRGRRRPRLGHSTPTGGPQRGRSGAAAGTRAWPRRRGQVPGTAAHQICPFPLQCLRSLLTGKMRSPASSRATACTPRACPGVPTAGGQRGEVLRSGQRGLCTAPLTGAPTHDNT